MQITYDPIMTHFGHTCGLPMTHLWPYFYLFVTQNTKTKTKVKADKNEIFAISYAEFDAEFVDRFAIFLAAKLTELRLIYVEKCWKSYY